jgi:hypothetical protein
VLADWLDVNPVKVHQAGCIVSIAIIIGVGDYRAESNALVGEKSCRGNRAAEFLQSYKAGIFQVVAYLYQFFFLDCPPQRRCRSTMTGDQIEIQCRLAIATEAGPVHGRRIA